MLLLYKLHVRKLIVAVAVAYISGDINNLYQNLKKLYTSPTNWLTLYDQLLSPEAGKCFNISIYISPALLYLEEH